MMGCRPPSTIEGRARWAMVALLGLLGLGGVGCNTYSYFQVHVQLADAFSTPRRAMIHTCHMFVTGAATDDTVLKNCSPPETNDVGVVDYSTFASSGNVTFTLKVYEGTGESNELGEGMTSLAISSGNTVKGDLMVNYTGPATTQ